MTELELDNLVRKANNGELSVEQQCWEMLAGRLGWENGKFARFVPHPVHAKLDQMEKEGKSGAEMAEVFKRALETGELKDNLKGLIPNRLA